MEHILIIEDDDAIRMGLEDDLRLEGYDVASATTGDAGLSQARTFRPDLIILDLMLPGMSGLDICKSVRAEGNTVPILVLTAKCTEFDKVLGLELGADDYMTKPFSPRELLSRVKALMRRSKTPVNTPALFHSGELEIDFRGQTAKRNGRPIALSALEFRLLRFFVEHHDELLTRSAILDHVWGNDVYVTPRTVDTHVGHLRQKLEKDPAHPRLLVGVRGLGYKFLRDEA